MGCDKSNSINSTELYIYIVLNIKLTNGTIISMMLSMLNNPFAELSSRLKILSVMASKKIVYAAATLLRRISTMTYFITLNIVTSPPTPLRRRGETASIYF